MSEDRPGGLPHATAQGPIRRTAGESVLVLGWGNPGRRDDGLGPRLADWVGALGIPGVHAESAYQLQVEHAEAVAQADVVVFVDADASGPAPFLARPLEPAGRPAFSTHALTPGTVLALAAELFGTRPRAVLLGIRGYAFDGFGERLTRQAEENLRAARAWVAAALAVPADRSEAGGSSGQNAGTTPAHAT
ncbi:MAG: hydrogenase maturation protease [Gemmatimonadota bacterium]